MTRKRKSSNDQAKGTFLGLKEIKGDFLKLSGLKEINIKGSFTQRPLKEIKGVDYSKLRPIKPRYAFVVDDKGKQK